MRKGFAAALMLLFVSLSLMGKSKELRVLQMNVWHEGTQVEGGFEAIADEVIHHDADVVMLSEIRNYHGKKFIPRLLAELQRKGAVYYGEHSEFGDVSVISKYPIQEHKPLKSPGNSLSKTRLEVCGNTVVVYSCHLDYTNDATFLPRGYDGNTWKKLPAPVTSVDEIVKMMQASTRGEGLQKVLDDAEKEKGNLIIIGGDFNEASHLDWNERTKDLWDHHGTVIPWECSTMLVEKGYKDSYREIYPNPVTHPAFTFPSDNPGVPVKRLAWAPDADERCRLDYIYYMPDKHLKLKEAAVVGPLKSILRNERVEEDSEDRILPPLKVWPSDHKATLAVFRVKK